MSDQPNLLICCFEVIPGPHGLSRRITEYLKGLTDKHTVVGLSVKSPDTSHIEKYHGARLLRVPVGTGDLASRIQAFDRAVRRQMESEEFQVVHCFDPVGGYALCELKADYGYKVVYDAATFPSQELRWSHPSTESDRRFHSKIRRQELFCLMNADAVVTGSEMTRQHIASLGVSQDVIHVMRAPVDLAPYTVAAMGRPDASPMKLVYLGNQHGYQGLPTVLRALQLALRQADVRLAIVGPRHPDWQVRLEDLVEDLKLKGKVEFQPPVAHDDVHKIIAAADVGLVPLDSIERNTVQGGPLAKLGEYLAGGRPVIASDLEITRELAPKEATVFFPPGDFKALADALVRLANDPARRVELGEAARAAAHACDASAIRGRLLDLYASLELQGASDARRKDKGEDTRSKKVAAAAATAPPVAERTDPAASSASATDRQPVLGLPLREPEEHLPVVVGEQLKKTELDDKTPTALTDPVGAGVSPPVVMGLPLKEEPPDTKPPPPVADLVARPLAQTRTPVRGVPPAERVPLSAGQRPTGGRVHALTGAPALSPTALPEGDEPLVLGLPPPPSAKLAAAPAPRGAVAPARAAAATAKADDAAEKEKKVEPAAPALGTESPKGTAGRGLPSPAIPPGSQAGAKNPLGAAALGAAGAPKGTAGRGLPSPVLASAAAPAAKAAPAATALGAPGSPRGTAGRGVPSPVAPSGGATSPRNPPPAPAPPARTGDTAKVLAPVAEDPPRTLPAEPTEVGQALRPGAAPGPAGTLPGEDAGEPEEVSDDEVMAVHDEAAPPGGDDVPEAEGDDVPEAEADEAPSGEVSMLSLLDPWLAQLVHGWCPPDAGAFSRLPPPTTFPGRDSPPAAGRKN